MGNLAILENGPLPKVEEEERDWSDWKWWLESSGPASHAYLQRPGQYSDWELMNSKKWRRVTKSLPGLWKDAYIQRGKRIEVREVLDSKGFYEYNLVLEDGEYRVVWATRLEGYNAKGAILAEMLDISDYQNYEVVVCQPTPVWATVVRLCKSKGVTVTKTRDGWIFES